MLCKRAFDSIKDIMAHKKSYCTSVHFRWILWRRYNIEKRSHANILQDTGLQLISDALPHKNDTAHVYFTKEFTRCKTKHFLFHTEFEQVTS